MNNQELIYKITSLIPKGKVLTYGQLASLAGVGSPRVIGSILHNNSDPKNVYCYRVVNIQGEVATNYAFGGASEQKKKLKKGQSSFLIIASKVLIKDTPGAKDTLAVETEKFLPNIATIQEEELQALTSKLTNKLWILADFSPFLDFKNLALLIFWSIVAGFSEKFVPNLLAKAEEKATVKSS